jgi:hypothetical protein
LFGKAIYLDQDFYDWGDFYDSFARLSYTSLKNLLSFVVKIAGLGFLGLG